jgi:hypothetical protein
LKLNFFKQFLNKNCFNKFYIFVRFVIKMGRRKKSEIGKVKIKLVAGKINEISLFDKEGNNLENELNEEGDRGFSEFIETGGARAPVLETGQETTRAPAAQVVERQPGEQTRPQEARSAAGLVNPEFSVYEIARQRIPTNTGIRRRDYVPQTTPGEDTSKPIALERAENVRVMSRGGRTGLGFVNKELESLQESRGRDYYDSRSNIEESKTEKRRPWEG